MTFWNDRTFPEIWITDETPPRGLIAKGRSAIDPDSLVAYIEGTSKSVWIIDDGSATKTDCYVCGLGGSVRARRIVENPPAPTPTALLPENRHDAWR